MRVRLDGSKILITGASSGIGAELARQLASRADTLILVARRVERLEALAAQLVAANQKLKVVVRACDVSDAPAVERLIAELTAQLGTVDVLINNAGMGDFGAYDLSSWEKTRRMLDVNIGALCHLTRLVAGPMVAQGRGAILNVSSGFGLEFMPGFAAYSGTKHFVTAFTECLRLELAGAGVVVSQLCPGPVATEFEQLAADFEAPKVPKAIELSAEQCVREALRGFERGKALIVPGFLMKLALYFGGRTPRWIKRLVYAPAANRLRVLQASAAQKALAEKPVAGKPMAEEPIGKANAG